MSTRSYIAIARPDGTYDAIYCHYDGYVKGGVGEELTKNYNERDKVEKLISLGNRRSLVNTPPEDDLYNEPYTKFKDIDSLHSELDNGIEFIYIFDLDNQWIGWTEKGKL